MDSFMTFAVEFFVWAFVALLGVWFIGFLLWPLGFLLELLAQPAKPKPGQAPQPRKLWYCQGAVYDDLPPRKGTGKYHTHQRAGLAEVCHKRLAAVAAIKAAAEAEAARCKHLHMIPVDSAGETVAGLCPDCDEQFYTEPGHRVTDGRTGEVVGYWTPSDA
jgi:hypothetical protein